MCPLHSMNVFIVEKKKKMLEYCCKRPQIDFQLTTKSMKLVHLLSHYQKKKKKQKVLLMKKKDEEKKKNPSSHLIKQNACELTCFFCFFTLSKALS